MLPAWPTLQRFLFFGWVALVAGGWALGSLRMISEGTVTLAYVGVVLLGGAPVVFDGIKAVVRGHFNVDLLASLAIIGAGLTGEFLAAAIIVLMISGGEELERYTSERASDAIRKLIESTPRAARVRRQGRESTVPIGEVRLGEIVVVRAGERIPVDGVVVMGAAPVDQAPVTGESMPVEKGVGSSVFAGTITLTGGLEVRVETVGEETTYGRIAELVRRGQVNRARAERVADRYAAWFTPLVLGAVALTYLVTRDLRATVSALVVASPCSLIIATPTAIVASLGNLARKGVMIRGGAILERIAKVSALVTDKTGTLTLGRPRIVEVRPQEGLSESEVVGMAATAERFSNHPVARAIVARASEMGVAVREPAHVWEFPGRGVLARLNGWEIRVGNRRFLSASGVALGQSQGIGEDGTQVLVSQNSSLAGTILFVDAPREDATQAIRAMRNLGIAKFVMLTGDKTGIAERIAAEVGIDKVEAELLPEGKVKAIQRLQQEGHIVAMIGDGINDAPALANADIGVAMGRTGTDIAVETADVVLLSDDLRKLPSLFRVSRRTLSIIKVSVSLGLAANLAGILLAAAGVLTPVSAALFHEMADAVVVGNSVRALRG